MIEKYGRLKNEYDKVVANEKILRGENDLLETHLSNRKDEIEILEDKVKDAAINKVADPIEKPADIEDDDEGINRKNIDDDVDKKDKVLSEKQNNDMEEEEEENL